MDAYTEGNVAEGIEALRLARKESNGFWLNWFEKLVNDYRLELSDFGESEESIEMLRKQCYVAEARGRLESARLHKNYIILDLFLEFINRHSIVLSTFGETRESIDTMRRQCYVIEARDILERARLHKNYILLDLFLEFINRHSIVLSTFGETRESIDTMRRQCYVIEARDILERARLHKNYILLDLFLEFINRHGIVLSTFGETRESIDTMRRQWTL